MTRSSLKFDEIIKGENSGPILKILGDLDISQPSKIQCQVIPILNEQKKDLILRAPNKNGKTIAFMISLLLHVDASKHIPQVICLCNSSELTMKNFKVFQSMNKYTQFHCALCLKDDNDDSVTSLKDAQLIFGTPSSISYHIKRSELDVSQVNFLVIDEADLLLDRDSKLFGTTNHLIDKLLPKNVQYGIFSTEFKHTTIDHLKNKRPDIVKISTNDSESTTQHCFTKVSNQTEALSVISDLINNILKNQFVQTYIFTRSKKCTNEFYEFLINQKINCKKLSSDLSPEDRDTILREFKSGKFNALITNQDFPREADVPYCKLVINYQTPIQFVPSPKNPKDTICFPDPSSYLKRAEKAGFYGKTGIVLSIIDKDKDEKTLKDFCSQKNSNIQLNEIKKDEIDIIYHYALHLI